MQCPSKPQAEPCGATLSGVKAKSEPPRKPGRPARLSREAALHVAERLIQQDGSEALSMRRVAETLGCSPMAICRHISGKDELLAGLMDRLIERQPRPDLPDDPRERLVALICWQHDGLAEVPWVLDAIAGGRVGPSIIWLMEGIYAALLASGLTLPQAATANRIIWGFMVGELHGEAARRRPVRSGQGKSALTSVDSEQYPVMASLAAYWRERSSGQPGSSRARAGPWGGKGEREPTGRGDAADQEASPALSLPRPRPGSWRRVRFQRRHPYERGREVLGNEFVSTHR